MRAEEAFAAGAGSTVPSVTGAAASPLTGISDTTGFEDVCGISFAIGAPTSGLTTISLLGATTGPAAGRLLPLLIV